ncbi:MAG: hypothetical protein ACFFG0_37675 [Candidatus Thorarchaeota archaeon]
MKKKRTIAIKDPKLQKIRNNLRMILIKWSGTQYSRLIKEQKKLLDDDGTEEYIKLEGEKQEIRKIMDGSICKCAVCSSPYKNMTYNPIKKEWYCVDCYKDLQEYYQDKKERFLFP